MRRAREEKKRKEKLRRLGCRRNGFCQERKGGREGRSKDDHKPLVRNTYLISLCVS